MKLHLSLLLFMGLIVSSCSSPPSSSKVMEELVNLQLELVPDKRVGIFDLNTTIVNGEQSFEVKTDQPSVKERIENDDIFQNQAIQVLLLPDASLGEKNVGIITLSVANIRTKPSHSAELATQALMGSPVNVLEKKGGWYRIQTPDHYIGWAESASLERVSQEGLVSWQGKEKGIVTTIYGHVWEKNKEGVLPVTDITAGNILELTSPLRPSQRWTSVALPDGRQGVIRTEYLRRFSEWQQEINPTSDDILATARLLTGVPYLWGGTSMKGVDCSGFTKMAYFMNGIQLPRDASQQVHSGELVTEDTTFSGLEKGDLLFFGRKASENQKEKVTHVAIYAGGGKIIHSSGRVREESLIRGNPGFNEYRLKTFIRAKRILSQLGTDGAEFVKELSY